MPSVADTATSEPSRRVRINREVALRERIIHALPGFPAVERRQQALLLKRNHQRIVCARHRLERQLANVSAVPCASGVARPYKPMFVVMNREVSSTRCKLQVACRCERKFLGIPRLRPCLWNTADCVRQSPKPDCHRQRVPPTVPACVTVDPCSPTSTSRLCPSRSARRLQSPHTTHRCRMPCRSRGKRKVPASLSSPRALRSLCRRALLALGVLRAAAAGAETGSATYKPARVHFLVVSSYFDQPPLVSVASQPLGEAYT